MKDGRRIFGAVHIVCAAVLLQEASAMKVPLAKTGPCPELKREPFEMGDNFRARFIDNNPTGDFTLKTNFGTIQSALTPEQSVNCHQVPPGLKYEMWASEKDVGNIISIQAFTFDERGRMWAVEALDYPNNLTDPFKGNDRIVILEDTDRDRVMDKHTVFASGLNIPQGIEIVPQGIAVAMAPYLLLFEDKDGDDKADLPQGKILYQGFKKGDTHGAIGSLRYGMDNWLYGSGGYNGGTIAGVTLTTGNLAAGIWRARLDGSRFEFIGPTFSGNTAAVGIMEDGQLFASSANCNHSQQAILPGVPAPRITSYGDGIVPLTKDLVQGDCSMKFTAATDHEFYTARLFPKEYWNRAAFVSEGTGHLVNMDFMAPNKSTWSANRVAATPNIFASSDAWVAPIMTKVGPDGAVWVVDWYTYIYLHNGMRPVGPGAGFISELRNRSRQRIYRIAPADGRLDPVLDLSRSSLEELVNTFKHPNMLWRLTAQKLVLRKAVTADAKARMEVLLEDILKRSWSKDEVGIDPYALHALWTAEGLGFFAANPSRWNPILEELLLHPAPSVRMNAMQAMPPTAASAAAIRDQGTVNDDDPHVRLRALITLSGMPRTDGIGMWTTYRNLDKWSQQAFTMAAGGSGLTEAAAKPASKPLHPETPVAVPGGWGDRGRKSLKFGRIRNGELQILPDGGLSEGVLTVFDIQGKVVARSEYDGRQWSMPLRNLVHPLYLFTFRSRNGDRLEGRITAKL